MELVISDDLKEFFAKDQGIDFEWNLKWPPRPYQEDVIERACRRKFGVFKVATAGGKSLILSYIWTNLRDNGRASKLLIVVPTTGLITQFEDDMVDYGIPAEKIGQVWAEQKVWDREIVVSTWQSLQNNLDRLDEFDAVFVDECHGAKATVLTDILKRTVNAKYRIGCTGTVPSDDLSAKNVMSYLGPQIAEYNAAFLIAQGFIAPVKIKQTYIDYTTKFSKDYTEAKHEIFTNQYRLWYIKEIVKSIKEGSCLLLVGLVKKEGQVLKEYLESFSDLDDREIVFMSGATKNKEREYWRKRAMDQSNRIVLISTYPIIQAGVNIPNLAHVVFAAPFKAEIRILQSIGRALRLHESKSEATIYDIVDLGNKWYPQQAEARYRYYMREEFPVEEIKVREKPIVDI